MLTIVLIKNVAFDTTFLTETHTQIWCRQKDHQNLLGFLLAVSSFLNWKTIDMLLG